MKIFSAISIELSQVKDNSFFDLHQFEILWVDVLINLLLIGFYTFYYKPISRFRLILRVFLLYSLNLEVILGKQILLNFLFVVRKVVSPKQANFAISEEHLFKLLEMPRLMLLVFLSSHFQLCWVQLKYNLLILLRSHFVPYFNI